MCKPFGLDARELRVLLINTNTGGARQRACSPTHAIATGTGQQRRSIHGNGLPYHGGFVKIPLFRGCSSPWNEKDGDACHVTELFVRHFTQMVE